MDIGSYKSNSNHYHHHAFRFHIRRFLFRNGQIQSEIADSMHNINIKMLGMSSHYVTIPPSSFAMPPPLAHSLDRLADTEAHANTTEGASLVNEAGIGTIQGQGVAGAKCEPCVAECNGEYRGEYRNLYSRG